MTKRRPKELHCGQIWCNCLNEVYILLKKEANEYGEDRWSMVRFTTYGALIPHEVSEAWLSNEVRHYGGYVVKGMYERTIRDFHTYCGCLPTAGDLREHGAALLQMEREMVEQDRYDQTES